MMKRSIMDNSSRALRCWTLFLTAVIGIAAVVANSEYTDNHEFCKDWAGQGECSNNPNYMLTNCARSCDALGFEVHPKIEPEKGEVTNTVGCSTTKGNLKIEIYRDWSPQGADHFLQLVRDGFFSDIGLFRCVEGFLVQFGISDKSEHRHWHNHMIQDDPNLNKGIFKHYLSYAGSGPNSRSTEMFIAFEDLDFLGKEPWETPFGMVVEGDDVLHSFYKEYGEIFGFNDNGVDQQKLYTEGNEYLRREFPDLDYILRCETDESRPV